MEIGNNALNGIGTGFRVNGMLNGQRNSQDSVQKAANIITILSAFI